MVSASLVGVAQVLYGLFYPPNRSKQTRGAPRKGSNKTHGAVSDGSVWARPTTRLAQPTTSRQVGFLPFPQRYITQLPWVWTTGLSASTSYVTGGVSYRLNSPYDPDAGVGGSSARQFAALAAIYNRYVVTRAEVHLRFSNSSADSHFVGYAIRRGNQTARTALADKDLMVLEHTALRPLVNTGTQEVSFDIDVPIEVPWGVSRQRLTDEQEYSAATSTNPSNEVYLDVLCYDSSAVASGSVVGIFIKYHTTFYEQKQA